jgi:hypothetical protein
MIKVSVESAWTKATFEIEPHRDGRSIFAVLAALLIAVHRVLRSFGQPVSARWELKGTAKSEDPAELVRQLRAASGSMLIVIAIAAGLLPATGPMVLAQSAPAKCIALVPTTSGTSVGKDVREASYGTGLRPAIFRQFTNESISGIRDVELAIIACAKWLTCCCRLAQRLQARSEHYLSARRGSTEAGSTITEIDMLPAERGALIRIAGRLLAGRDRARSDVARPGSADLRNLLKPLHESLGRSAAGVSGHRVNVGISVPAGATTAVGHS